MADNRAGALPHRQLIYFADPMCSWCWGFAPVMDAVRAARPDLPVRLVLGGLRPFTTDRMDEARKAAMRHHWTRVEALSGQPFDYAFFARDDFVYDTEPAARAVVAARRLDPRKEFAMNERVACGFYAENRDVTDPAILCDLAEEAGFDRAVFAAEFALAETKAETLGDFETTRRSGVTGFPTLLAGPNDDGTGENVAAGYQLLETVLSRLETWTASRAQAAR